MFICFIGTAYNRVQQLHLTISHVLTLLPEHAQQLHQAYALWTGSSVSPVFIPLCSYCALQCILSLQLWNLLLRRCIHQQKYVLSFPFLPIFLYPGFHEFCWHALGLPQVFPQSCPVRTSRSACSKHEGWQSELTQWLDELSGVRPPFMGARKHCSLHVILDEAWETNSWSSLNSSTSCWTFVCSDSLSLLLSLIGHGSEGH